MLAITNIVTINVSQAPLGLGALNVNMLALFTTDPTPAGWAVGQDYAIYVAASSVESDFGTSSETYKQAVAVFSQNPNMLSGGGALIIVPIISSLSSSSSRSSSSSSSCRSSSSSSSSSSKSSSSSSSSAT